jgi:polyhydroxyalkanoate synthase
MQGFIVWREMLNRVLDRADTTHEDRERARFVLQLFTETFAPTNTLFGNPGALQRITETRGKSLIYGVQNFIDDLTNNFGMPRQVDERKFQVGKNLAITPGAVVYRGDVFELIQYTPQTDRRAAAPAADRAAADQQVLRDRPVAGPQFAEFAVRSGVQTFCISWRNPTAAQRDWNVETYLTACKEAIAVAREISGADRVNTMAACAGGFTLAALLGHLAARATTASRAPRCWSPCSTPRRPPCSASSPRKPESRPAIEKSRRQGVLEGSEMARVFAWLRPNDLVWLFVANNWVMGNRPPAFDILYWNSDTTRLPAEFHADLLRMFMDNPLKTPGSLTALGTPIDMGKVQVPAYVVAGITDHITPWQACYQSKNILRGKIDFVLSSSGHIQSIVNPPTNPKARYFLNSALPGLCGRLDVRRSERPGQLVGSLGRVVSPARLVVKFRRRVRSAAAQNPAGDPAPGRYVHQR